MANGQRQQIGAIELLKQVVQQRGWHQNKVSHAIASEAKRNLAKGKVSYEYACKLLNMIGYEKVEDEVWQCPAATDAATTPEHSTAAATNTQPDTAMATTEGKGTGQ